MNLSDTAIRSAKLRSKDYKLFDEGGLYLLITPNGVKRWRFKYCFEGKKKLLALGDILPFPSRKLASEDWRRKKSLLWAIAPNGRAYNRTVHLAECTRMMARWVAYLDELRLSVD